MSSFRAILVRLLVGFVVLLALSARPAFAQAANGEKLLNGGFEKQTGELATGWEAFGAGYDIDQQNHHSGAQSIRCDSLRITTVRGASARITLNQTSAVPVLVTGWSKADEVSGTKDSDYSLYVDLEYTDGTPLWGLYAALRTGTHDWERTHLLVTPAKPIKTLTVYALFRKHTGTAWFDDFSARELSGAGLLDSQPLLPLPHRNATSPDRTTQTITAKDGLTLGLNAQGDIVRLVAGAQTQNVRSEGAGGFWLRDVAAESALTPARGICRPMGNGGVQIESAPAGMGLRLKARITPEQDALVVDGQITDITKTDRAVTVYLALPIQADGWQWGHTIRNAEIIRPDREYSDLTRVNVGATGGLSLYPFACVSNSQNGLGIGNQMDWPGVYRLFYNGMTRQFVIAWDFALSGKTVAWPAHAARFRCWLFRLLGEQASWGFRAVAQRFYRLNAPRFDRRTKQNGIWMPFTSPSYIQGVQDFGIAFHEGDNSLKADDELGILSFRYTEPMTYWLPMPPEMPRTYENALALINKNAQTGKPEERDNARATLNSGTQDENGRFNLTFRNEPWANGAVFVLNPNPELPASADKPTKAWLNYTLAMGDRLYGKNARTEQGVQDGEYLDSLEDWGDTQDYRPAHLASSPYPLSFDTDTHRATLPQWFSTHAFVRFLSNDLHSRGKLLMANSTPRQYTIFAPLMDVMGIEVSWIDAEGRWQPDSDETFCLRRTLSAQKPYCLLMNVNFNKFPYAFVAKYFQRCLFYGVFPGMFSADAATHPYWEDAALYNRDRPLFKRYLPLFRQISAAGWEPITYARSANANIWVERFGPRLFTVFNPTGQSQTTTLAINRRALGLPAANLHASNLLTGEAITLQSDGTQISLPVHLNAEEVGVIALR